MSNAQSLETYESAAPTAPVAAQDWLGLPVSVWIKIGLVGGLMTALFWHNLWRLWEKTNPIYGEANWGHAICVPIIGLYYLYVHRERLLELGEPVTRAYRTKYIESWSLWVLMAIGALFFVEVYMPRLFDRTALAVAGGLLLALPVFWPYRRATFSTDLADWLWVNSAAWFGAYIMIFGIALFSYGIWPGQNDFVKDFGMVTTLFGVVLMLAGWPVMRTAWFPIAFLVCAIPWPGLVYSKVAGPLQVLAARVAVQTLQMTGVKSFDSGTKIFIYGYNNQLRTLNVAEACAGLRSLMTFISVAGAVAFLSARPLWQKVLMTASAVPIAILCNVMRVSGQGLLDHYVSPQLSESFAHQFVGLIMLIPAFGLILLVGWLLDKIFLEEIDDRHDEPVKKAPTSTTPQSAAPTWTAAGTAAPVPGRSLAAARQAAHKPMPSMPPSGVRPMVVPPPSIRLATRAPTVRGTPPRPAGAPPAAPNRPADPPPPSNPRPETV